MNTTDNLVSARRIVSAGMVREGGAELLLEAASLVAEDVRRHNAGREVQRALFYVTYEELLEPLEEEVDEEHDEVETNAS